MLNRLKCKHSSKLVDCRVDHKTYPLETTLTVSTLKPALKTSANMEKPAKSVAVEETPMPATDIRRNPDALKNCGSVDTLFIGSEALAEMKE